MTELRFIVTREIGFEVTTSLKYVYTARVLYSECYACVIESYTRTLYIRETRMARL